MITLIIVNYNAGGLLADCVLSALHQVHEIIIVDNASSDTSLENCLAKFANNPKVQLIRNKNNLGFAKGCNIGLQASQGNILMFLNPDAQLSSDCIQHLTKVLYSSKTVGMVGGLVLNNNGTEQRGARRDLPTPANTLSRISGTSKSLSSKFRVFTDFNLDNTPLPPGPTRVQAISGSCMLVKREAIDDVGLWDEGYFLHCEDLDLCMRFHQKGWTIMFVPDAKVTHAGGGCSKSRPIFVEWHKHKGMLRFYRKFFKDQYPALLWPVVVTAVWLRFSAIAGYYFVRHMLRRVGFFRD